MNGEFKCIRCERDINWVREYSPEELQDLFETLSIQENELLCEDCSFRFEEVVNLQLIDARLEAENLEANNQLVNEVVIQVEEEFDPADLDYPSCESYLDSLGSARPSWDSDDSEDTTSSLISLISVTSSTREQLNQQIEDLFNNIDRALDEI